MSSKEFALYLNCTLLHSLLIHTFENNFLLNEFQAKSANIAREISTIRTRSFYGPYFPAFGLNMEKYGTEKL